MTITHQDELDGLEQIGGIVANTMHSMAAAMDPGMTTRELDSIGRKLLEREGAVSAPQATYEFPSTTCISVDGKMARDIPSKRRLAVGDQVNGGLSASLNGYYTEPGASFASGQFSRPFQLCRDGKRTMQIGIAQVGA